MRAWQRRADRRAATPLPPPCAGWRRTCTCICDDYEHYLRWVEPSGKPARRRMPIEARSRCEPVGAELTTPARERRSSRSRRRGNPRRRAGDARPTPVFRGQSPEPAPTGNWLPPWQPTRPAPAAGQSLCADSRAEPGAAANSRVRQRSAPARRSQVSIRPTPRCPRRRRRRSTAGRSCGRPGPESAPVARHGRAAGAVLAAACSRRPGRSTPRRSIRRVRCRVTRSIRPARIYALPPGV